MTENRVSWLLRIETWPTLGTLPFPHEFGDFDFHSSLHVLNPFRPSRDNGRGCLLKRKPRQVMPGPSENSAFPPRLLHQNHLLRSHIVSRLYPIEIHAARQCRSIELHVMVAGLLGFLHKYADFLPEGVVNSQ